MSTTQEILEIIAEKKRAYNELGEDIVSLERTLRILGYDKNNASTIPVNEIKVETGFPKKADKKIQVLWIFDNVLKGGVKRADFQKIYEDLSGLQKQDNIIVSVKRLINANILRGVKYNNTNTLTFYGKIEWIENDDFKEAFYPDGILVGQYSSRVIDRAILPGK